MSIKKQYDFVMKQLEESAASVGIDIETSYYGLIEIYNRLAHTEMEIEPDAHVEADGLFSEFGKNENGLELLYAIGEACFFAGGAWRLRNFDEKLETAQDFKIAGWSGWKERSLCDFAMFTGIAAAVCAKHKTEKTGSQLNNVYSHFGRKGALIRHAPMKKLRDWTIAQYKSGNFKSANAAAHALVDVVVAHGRTINASLSEENAQRTIAEWIRKSV